MLAPVSDPKTGEVILFDIFVGGKWVGSRRIVRQCIDTLTMLRWPSAVMASDFQINDGKIIFGPPTAGTSHD